MAKLKSHPYADLFPMMDADELEALAADIAENGLRQPIVLYQRQVLDGRNRLLACEKVKVEPTFTEHKGDDDSALALVISLNVQRRDLTAAQRAIVAARVMEQYPRRWGGDRKSDQVDGTRPLGRAAGDAAREFKISRESVQYAKAIRAEAPDLAEHVEAGTSTLAAAWEALKERREAEKQRVRDTALIVKWGLWDAVRGGEMTFEAALEQAKEREQEERESAAAEADARRNWLKELADLIGWLERFVLPRSDEHLSWYTRPGSPGLFDHGITGGRVAAAVDQLERVRSHTFGGSHDRDGQDDRQGSQKAHPRAV